MQIKITFLPLVIYFFSFTSVAQEINSTQNEERAEFSLQGNDAANPCITPEEYKIIQKQCSENIKLLGLNNSALKSTMTTLFSWPLRAANGLSDYSYYYIGNYVDQDTTSPHIKDWYCDSTTYDGHRGTDICTSPYPFYKMDNNQVEVIAAAPGTIINKVDGNFDKNCAINNSTANYIIVGHADGSYALYWHMKKNSLTAKTVGQTVVTGEYLGVVGSSGDASGPHLHFEVWSGINANTLKDPYSGPCNILNANSWWANQKPYTEPAIIKAQINLIAPVLPACPATETPNEDTCFNPGVNAKFYIFIRNETPGLVANMRIINQDGSTFSSWTHNSIKAYNIVYWISTKTLPGTTGTYTFEAKYNGMTCNRKFYVNCNSLGVPALNELNKLNVYPDPFKNIFNISATTELGTINIYNIIGEIVYSKSTGSMQQQIDLSNHPSGIYILSVQGKYIRVIKD